MKKQWIGVAAGIMIFLSAIGAAAQAPQGAGATKTEQSSDTPRSYNPIKWMKKGPNTTTEEPKNSNNKKPSEQRSEAPRSYNPIKWIKKDPNTTTEKPKKSKNKKPSEKSATPETAPRPRPESGSRLDLFLDLRPVPVSLC